MESFNVVDGMVSLGKHEDFDDNFVEAVKKMAGVLKNTDSVKSCLALACNGGHTEMDLIRYCLPKVDRFVAVEAEHDCIVSMRTRREILLPKMALDYNEMTVDDFMKKRKPEHFDVIMLLWSIYHFDDAERKSLLEKLSQQWLAPGGRIVIVGFTKMDQPQAINHLFRRIGEGVVPWETIEADVMSAGLKKEHIQEMMYNFNWKDMDLMANVMLMIYAKADFEKVKPEQVTAALKELYPNERSANHVNIGVYQKA